ncbi:MAG: hypothetical protein QNJ90_10735 [Planctomycetota bacterium]|nr:hypothetical protein [Planctomycetota bacterium]
MRTLALALVLLAAGGTALAGDKRPRSTFDLPPVLTRHGFGDPKAPVTVTYASPSGDKAALPSDAATGGPLPYNTSWVFRDPAPVWKALRGATTRRFLDGQFPGADARLIIEVRDRHTRRRIHLHYRQGHGDVSVRGTAPHGRASGGAWQFDPAADAALVALLSRTKPTYVGAPALRVYQVHGLAHVGAPRVRVLESAQALEDLKSQLTWRYPRTSSWKLPPGFDWKTHMLVYVQLSKAWQRKKLNWSNGRVRDGVLRWRLYTQDDKPGAKPVTLGSALLGAFAKPKGLTHVRADIDERIQVGLRVPMNDDYHTPQPEQPFLVVQERHHDGKQWRDGRRVQVHFDGHYRVRHTERMIWRGRIPQALCMRLRASLKADPAAQPLRTVTYTLHVDDMKVRHPDGIQELAGYIERVHRDP